MNAISEEFSLNLTTLKKCRLQLRLTIEEVKKKVGSISEIEEGKKLPTYRQLSLLGDLYEVPRWIFISDEFPEKYQYASQPSFRTFKDARAFQDTKVRKLVARIEGYRDFLLDLREDLENPLTSFSESGIPIDEETPIDEAAESVRTWLGLDKAVEFDELRKKIEAKSIFVFLTNKFSDWSKIEREAFRGLCITHEKYPIIIVNDSDAKKALSFTLLHELGHLMQKTASIDEWEQGLDQKERRCDELAGRILMPENDLRKTVNVRSQRPSAPDFSEIKKIAQEFKVSTYACLVRMRQIEQISQEHYETLETELKDAYRKAKEEQKKSPGGPSRDRSKEIRRQFGDVFVGTVLTAWRSHELTLHKASQIFGLGKPEYVMGLEE